MKKLEVFVIDKARCRLTGSIPYTSLLWSRRYYECGYFMMTIPADIYTEEWAYICTPDRPETGRIQKVEYQDTDTTGAGKDTIILWGYFLESYMYDHTFLVEERRQYEELIQATRPTNPMINNYVAENFKKTLYVTGNGEYVTTDSQGNLKETDTNGVQKSVAYANEVTPAGQENKVIAFNTDKGQEPKRAEQVQYRTPINTYYYYDESDKLHAVGNQGDQVIQDKVVAVANKNEAVYYKNDSGEIFRAYGITQNRNNLYTVKMYNYVHQTKRTVTVKGYWQTLEMNDPYQNIDPVKHLMQWVQNFYQNGLIYAEPTFSCTPRVIDPSLRSLGQVLYDELKTEQASFRIVYDFELDKMVFEIWRGKDKTQSQTLNPWSVFSDEWGTLYNFDASYDTSSYKNTCYVLYDYDEPNSWVGNNPYTVKHYTEINESETPILVRQWDGWYIPYKSNKGFEKVTVGDVNEPERAIYLDLRDRKPEADSDWKRDVYPLDSNNVNKQPTFENANIKASYTGFKEGLLNEGRELLKNEHGIVENLDTGTLNLDRYLKEFDLGDKVDMTIAQIGIKKECRIIGVDETYEADEAAKPPSISVIMGDEKITNARKAWLV